MACDGAPTAAASDHSLPRFDRTSRNSYTHPASGLYWIPAGAGAPSVLEFGHLRVSTFQRLTESPWSASHASRNWFPAYHPERSLPQHLSDAQNRAGATNSALHQKCAQNHMLDNLASCRG